MALILADVARAIRVGDSDDELLEVQRLSTYAATAIREYVGSNEAFTAIPEPIRNLSLIHI